MAESDTRKRKFRAMMHAHPLRATLCLAALFAPLTGRAAEVVMHSFNGTTDGAYPAAPLAVGGTGLVSTTSGAGRFLGNVFSIATSGAYAFSNMHSFSGAPDGAQPDANLVKIGLLYYGTTYGGGQYNGGTVYSVNSAGTVKILHSFGGVAGDGNFPASGLVAIGSVLYGTTQAGGAYHAGTVFSLTTSGAETVLHSFGAGNDGATPVAGLTRFNTNTFYGTTEEGGAVNGANCLGVGCGTVFSITTTGTYATVYAFTGGNDAQWPLGGLALLNGKMYGTTGAGGPYGNGTAYLITSTGRETVLHTFVGSPDGAAPIGNLIVVNGLLYGTTSSLGGAGNGTVFKMTTAGALTTTYSFQGGSDGANPSAGLVQSGSLLYGTTNAGGAYGYGTVYSVTP